MCTLNYNNVKIRRQETHRNRHHSRTVWHGIPGKGGEKFCICVHIWFFDLCCAGGYLFPRCLYLIISVCLLCYVTVCAVSDNPPAFVLACVCMYAPTCTWVEVTVLTLCSCLHVCVTDLWVIETRPRRHHRDIPVRSSCPPLCHPLLMLGWPSPRLLSVHSMFLLLFFLLTSNFSLSFVIFSFYQRWTICFSPFSSFSPFLPPSNEDYSSTLFW